jgi:hypothetical protein
MPFWVVGNLLNGVGSVRRWLTRPKGKSVCRRNTHVLGRIGAATCELGGLDEAGVSQALLPSLFVQVT